MDARAARCSRVPPSLAHIADGDLLATAAGRYLGKEANGTREGNQFTHAVVTRNRADYGLIRPAQLWSAPWWADGPAAGAELDPIPAHPEPGILDTETVRDRVRDTSDGANSLIALLSAVQRLTDPEARRTIVLVSSDPEAAACWIAAATLLVPASEALRTTFKIFVADASYSNHDIIGVHPEWAGRWGDTGPGTGLAVFDLDRHRHTPIEPTEDARFWVPRFLTEDVFDVVDAVELAGQFATAREGGVAATPADRAVALVVAAGEELSGPEQVQEAADWLRTAPESVLVMARDIVIDAVLAAHPGSPVLRTLADAAGNRGWDVLATIHRGLLSSELADVQAAPDGLAALDALRAHTALIHIGTAPPDEDRDTVEAALRGARPDLVPALLTLARRHKVDARTGEETARAFASWWLPPEPGFAPDRWPAPPAAVGWVRDELRRMLAAGGAEAGAAVDAIEQRWWRPLWRDARDLEDALDRHLLGTAYRHLDRVERPRIARSVVEFAADNPPRGTPPDVRAWQVLFGPGAPPLPEAQHFVDQLADVGLPMSAPIAERLCAVLDQEPDGSGTALALAHRISASGHPLSEYQQYRLDIDTWVQRIAYDLRADTAPPKNHRISDRLANTPPEVLEMRAPLLVDAIVETRHRDRAIAAVCESPATVVRPLYQELERRWPQRGAPVTRGQAESVAFGFRLICTPPRTAEQRRDFPVLANRLGTVVATLSKADRAMIERTGGLGEPWWAWVAEVEPRRLRLPRLGRSKAKDG